MRRRVWCETLPYEVVRLPHVLGALAARGVGLVLAVRPWDLHALPDVASACRAAGVELALWPMVADEDGRWASAKNAERFAAFALRVEQVMRERGVAPREIALDLEPPIGELRALLALRPAEALGYARARIAEYARARAVYTDLVAGLSARGVLVSAALVPLVLYDDPAGHPTWQKALGTPVFDLGLSHASVMLYSSIVEGWSRGVLQRADARALLFALARSARERLGDRAGVSLGVVGAGALGDEPVYRGPEELAEDVALARGAGVDDLTLFDLGGIVARPPADAWLDAFVLTGTASAAPPPTLAARAAAPLLGASAASIRALAPLLRRGVSAT